MSGTVTYAVERVEAETEKAILVEIEGEKMWVPKSQIHDDSEVYSKEHGDGDLVVTEWWATQKGLV
jgi:oxalate decarboxylase/phosphoglucose isomerase-like protein (cupin superfamily)